MNATKTKTAQADHALYLLDKCTPWRLGEICLFAVMRTDDRTTELPVGAIVFNFDKTSGEPTYTGVDTAGNEIFPPTNSLPELKRRFKAEQEQLIELAKARAEERSLDPMQSFGKATTTPPTEPVASPYQEKATAAENERTKKIDRARMQKKGKSRGR